MSFGQNLIFGDSLSRGVFVTPAASDSKVSLGTVPALNICPRFLLCFLSAFKGGVRFFKWALRIINTYSPSLIKFLSFMSSTHTQYFNDLTLNKQANVV